MTTFFAKGGRGVLKKALRTDTHGVKQFYVKNKKGEKWVMSLAENLKLSLSASITFDRSNAKMG